ncbi:MAG: TonB-dependent receptor [Sulfurovaceae bacterium]|nr:TonB-dependent receptor [Sulfurovaceae bacterium]
MQRKILLSTAVILTLSSTNMMAKEILEDITIVTTATKTERNIDGITASIEVMTAEDIKKVGGESLKDIINHMSGVQMQFSGGAGSSGQPKSAISMRGISAKGTLILIDGRRLATEFKKAYDLNRIPASQIERIEVIKGPMSTLYGSDASGGVVNIITKKPKMGKTEIDFGLRYGQNGDGDAQNQNINMGVKSSVGKLRYSLYANQTNTEPYTQKESRDVFTAGKKKSDMKRPSENGKIKGKVPDSYENEDITYRDESEILSYGTRVDYEVVDGTTIGAEVNIMEEERSGTYFAAYSKSKYKNAKDKPIKLTNVPINSKEKNEKIDIAMDITSHLSDDLTLSLRAYNSQYEKESTSTSAKWKDLGYPNEASTHKTKMAIEIDITAFEGMVNYALNDQHLLTGGVEQRTERRDSFVFKGGTQEVEHQSIYLQDEWEVQDTLNVVAGVRYDDISDADSKATYKLGAVKNFSKLLNLRANFAQGYRTPDTKELHVYRSTTKGTQRGAATVDAELGKANYNLKPEFTNAYELGLSGRDNKFRYSSAIFLNKIENQISNVKKDNYFTYENISKAETKGLELSIGYEISDNLSTGFSWTELQTEDKKTGKDLEYQPERVVTLNLDYQATPNLSVGLMAKHIGEQYFVEVINRGEKSQSKKDSTIDAYNSVDLSSSYEINENFNLYGGVENILDSDVNDAIGSTVGRYYYVGIRAKF